MELMKLLLRVEFSKSRATELERNSGEASISSYKDIVERVKLIWK